MRILAGKYKGKFIIMPKGIRPTQNKVRKALFDILGDIEGLSFLEFYAGSASIGFEAVSRGVKELVLVESSFDCQSAIKKNIAGLDLKICDLYCREAEKAIEILYKNKKRFDIIFLDPPYYKDEAKKTLQSIGAYDIVAPNGFVVVQHYKKDILPQTTAGLTVFKRSRYGDTLLSFYKKIDFVG